MQMFYEHEGIQRRVDHFRHTSFQLILFFLGAKLRLVLRGRRSSRVSDVTSRSCRGCSFFSEEMGRLPHRSLPARVLAGAVASVLLSRRRCLRVFFAVSLLAVFVSSWIATTGNVIRKMTFESCDSRNQKVIVTVNPGDALVLRCAGAVSSVPADINTSCCHDAGARCTAATKKTYAEMFPTAPPEFVFSYGDGVNTAWQLKIPENAKPPYPSFSVGWQGPRTSVVNSSVRTAPQTTVVIRVEGEMESEILVSITSTISRSAASTFMVGRKLQQIVTCGALALAGLLATAGMTG
uniref:SAG-related sequence SRS33 n=1 Tax=Toxoplasma gondii COUG TaxID=1074873 RepID=A0A2G8Y686_TOXGO|nr:SAG-related sequence SRS33 [Toxoplasma gondii COUG]